MSYSLKSFEVNGANVPAKSVPKLTEEFFDYFEVYTDDEGNIIDFFPNSMKLNFEAVLQENASLFSSGTRLEMIGEESDCFSYVIDPDSEDGYWEYSGVAIYPKTQIEEDCAAASERICKQISESDITKTGCPVSVEFDSFDMESSTRKRYRITVEEIGKYMPDGTFRKKRGVE